jgi:hypothetical protein
MNREFVSDIIEDRENFIHGLKVGNLADFREFVDECLVMGDNLIHVWYKTPNFNKEVIYEVNYPNVLNLLPGSRNDMEIYDKVTSQSDFQDRMTVGDELMICGDFYTIQEICHFEQCGTWE